MSILSIENLSYTYPGGQKAVLRSVSADFEAGKMYASASSPLSTASAEQ